MQTFSIQTLGCKVNQYESEQIAVLLRSHGLVQVEPGQADVRVINTCSVTTEAASKSRATIRRATRLPVLPNHTSNTCDGIARLLPQPGNNSGNTQVRVIATGCWATSNPQSAGSLPGVDAVIGHGEDVAAQLHQLISTWRSPKHEQQNTSNGLHDTGLNVVGLNGVTNPLHDVSSPNTNKPSGLPPVKQNSAGTTRLPLLGESRTGNQRAVLKIQDGCDAHCTYCIIPSLRPSLWSKPIEDAVAEARQLIAAGHVELVLTGIFLGAYGQPTALRRRQVPMDSTPLTGLIRALCTQVPGLRRLRLSSLEPGDLTEDLIRELRQHDQVVPHFHLPLQSGSDGILHKMNRQYTRDDFSRMIDRVYQHYDRPALTTDIIAGFPGETDADFADTLAMVDRARFIHVHAFPFSPRPGTAANRWTKQFINSAMTNARIAQLIEAGKRHGLSYRQTFLGQEVEVITERSADPSNPIRHGRSPFYFDVYFEDITARPGDAVMVRINQVTPERTCGAVRSTKEPAPLALPQSIARWDPAHRPATESLHDHVINAVADASTMVGGRVG